MGVKEARTAATNVYRVARNMDTRLRAIRAFNDPNLSTAGLNQARDERTKAVITSAKAKAQAFVKTAQDGRDFAASRVAEHRPKVDLNNVAVLTRTAQNWDMLVKPMREKGMNWSEIAAQADWDTLHAIARFAPQTVKLEDPRGADEVLRNLEVAMDRRTAEIHPDDSVRVLFQEAFEADQALSAATSMASAIDQAYSPEGVVAALVSGQRSLHGMGLLPQEPPLTNEQQDHLTELVRSHGIGVARNTVAGESGLDIVSAVLPTE